MPLLFECIQPAVLLRVGVSGTGNEVLLKKLSRHEDWKVPYVGYMFI